MLQDQEHASEQETRKAGVSVAVDRIDQAGKDEQDRHDAMLQMVIDIWTKNTTNMPVALAEAMVDELTNTGIADALVTEVKHIAKSGISEAAMQKRIKDIVLFYQNNMLQQLQQQEDVIADAEMRVAADQEFPLVSNGDEVADKIEADIIVAPEIVLPSADSMDEDFVEVIVEQIAAEQDVVASKPDQELPVVPEMVLIAEDHAVVADDMPMAVHEDVETEIFTVSEQEEVFQISDEAASDNNIAVVSDGGIIAQDVNHVSVAGVIETDEVDAEFVVNEKDCTIIAIEQDIVPAPVYQDKQVQENDQDTDADNTVDMVLPVRAAPLVEQKTEIVINSVVTELPVAASQASLSQADIYMPVTGKAETTIVQDKQFSTVQDDTQAVMVSFSAQDIVTPIVMPSVIVPIASDSAQTAMMQTEEMETVTVKSVAPEFVQADRAQTEITEMVTIETVEAVSPVTVTHIPPVFVDPAPMIEIAEPIAEVAMPVETEQAVALAVQENIADFSMMAPTVKTAPVMMAAVENFENKPAAQIVAEIVQDNGAYLAFDEGKIMVMKASDKGEDAEPTTPLQDNIKDVVTAPDVFAYHYQRAVEPVVVQNITKVPHNSNHPAQEDDWYNDALQAQMNSFYAYNSA